MPQITLPPFSFAAVYVGDFGAIVPMTQIPDLRTNGAILRETLPTNYEVALDNLIQSANHTFTVALSFISDSVITQRLSRGLTLTTHPSSAPAQSQYTMLLVTADQTIGSNYFFPKIRTAKTREVRYGKSAPSITEITFLAENRDPNVVLAYQDTISTLIPIMSSISPF